MIKLLPRNIKPVLNVFIFFILSVALFIITPEFSAQSISAADSTIEITISAVGDLMCHSDQFKYALSKDGIYDFNPQFRYIKKYLINSDLTFGNLETVTAGISESYSGYPLFNTPAEYITALKNSGFNFLTTANNHSLDRGEKGILRTITEIRKNDINSTGTFTSRMDKDSIRIIDIKGIGIALLAYTYGTNGNPIPSGKSYLINLIDTNLIKSNIKKASDEGADIIIVCLHFGNEYQSSPSFFQQEIVKKTIKYGADIIIGSHPHVLQPIKYFKSKNIKMDSGLAAYSLGNFFSGQRRRYRNSGIILKFSIQKNINNGRVKLKNISYVPTYVFKGKIENSREYLILPAEEAVDNSFYNFLDVNDLYKIRESLSDTKKIITEYSSRIQLYDYEEDLIKSIRRLAIPCGIYVPQFSLKLQGE